jgi:tetratricopeptide (TPR) repeat protein
MQKVYESDLFSQKRGLYLDSTLLIYPTNAYLWQQKAMPLFKQRKYEIGMMYLDSAVKYNADYIDYRAFMKCIFQKDYRSSIKDFRLASTIKGNSYVMDHPYPFYEGLCYLQLNKIDSAGYSINKCIQNEIKLHGESWVHFMHWFYYGIVLFEKEDYTNAISYFDKCLKIYANLPDAKYYKAICLENLQKVKPALDLFIEAESDLKQGYTNNEGNALYEAYPYQASKYMIDFYIKKLKQKIELGQ